MAKPNSTYKTTRETAEREIAHYQKVINQATQALRANKSILKNLDKIEGKSK